MNGLACVICACSIKNMSLNVCVFVNQYSSYALTCALLYVIGNINYEKSVWLGIYLCDSL